LAKGLRGLCGKDERLNLVFGFAFVLGTRSLFPPLRLIKRAPLIGLRPAASRRQ
jgi:hypothetical protein